VNLCNLILKEEKKTPPEDLTLPGAEGNSQASPIESRSISRSVCDRSGRGEEGPCCCRCTITSNALPPFRSPILRWKTLQE
jgi:hypothetical protein